MRETRHSHLRLHTDDGLTFALPLASPLPRLLAVSIDTFAVLAFHQVLSISLLLLGVLSRDFAQAFNLLAFFLLMNGYFIFMEWAWQGQTLGKRLLRLRVIDAQALRLTFSQVLLRNLLRVVDGLPGLYLLGGIVAFLSPKGQRLGDIAAGTIVTMQRDVQLPQLGEVDSGKYNSLRQFPHLEAQLRQQVPAAFHRLALLALLRREKLTPEARLELFGELATKFQEYCRLPAELVADIPDEQLVRNCIDSIYRSRGSDSGATPPPTGI